MTSKPTVFEQTYDGYIDRIKALDLAALGDRLGGVQENDALRLSLFERDYWVSADGIVDASGRQPGIDTCIILCQYVLRCPEEVPREKDWVAYRDFKDSGPLTVYFANDVERAIAVQFSGDVDRLQRCAQAIGGFVPTVDLNYDLVLQFKCLPKISMLLLYNEADDEFEAQSSVLYERRAEAFLDAESLAIAGRKLYRRLTQSNIS